MNSIYPKHPFRQTLPDKQLERLVNSIKDWQLANGSLLKLVQSEEEHTVLSRPIGVTLFPSLFPRTSFEEANSLQYCYNQLYAAVADSENWLANILENLIQDDKLASILWNIHLNVKQEGYAQDLTLGLFRSDYMIQKDDTYSANAQLRQVEFNTFSIAGGSHGNRASVMHRYLKNIGIYQPADGQDMSSFESSFPSNETIISMASALKAAYNAYGSPKHINVVRTCILFVVQPFNINICDERPIEYVLWEQNPPVPAFRIEISEIESQTSYGMSRELLYRPPWCAIDSKPYEVSVVYLRAFYDLEEYDTVGIAARLKLEKSRAIKCPSLLSHMTTFKKVQQALAEPGALQSFLPSVDADRIANTFVKMYALDDSDSGKIAQALACDPKTAVGYVLKPSLEGGGHNVYGKDIPRFLGSIPKSQWHIYILMEVIKSPTQLNLLMSPRGPYTGEVVSELGIFGACLWRQSNGTASGPEILVNNSIGWSLKTKPKDVHEMSVVKGYGKF